MAHAIKTEFDDTLDQDVALEQIDGKEPAVSTTLKNAENIYKSFQYMKKIYAGSLSSAKVFSMGNIDSADYVDIDIPEGATDARISNTSTNESTLYLNGGEYNLQPGEILEIPIVHPNPNTVPPTDGDALKLKGTVSYILLISIKQ